jgi:hypothetical protein
MQHQGTMMEALHSKFMFTVLHRCQLLWMFCIYFTSLILLILTVQYYKLI